MVNLKQIRAARGWLGWSQKDLSEASGVSQRTIAGLEKERRIPNDRTLNDIARAFEDAGVVFLSDDQGLGIGIKQTS